jgi:hypothetical protein
MTDRLRPAWELEQIAARHQRPAVGATARHGEAAVRLVPVLVRRTRGELVLADCVMPDNIPSRYRSAVQHPPRVSPDNNSTVTACGEVRRAWLPPSAL